MKTIRRNFYASAVPRIVCFFSILFCGLFARAVDVDLFAAVRAVDDERVAATVAADKVRLDHIYSDGLRYAHANGKIDDKAAHLEGMVQHVTVYEKIDYQTREFQPVAPGVMLMVGRAVIYSSNAKGRNQSDVNFLAVWREEQGRWRFLSWLASKNPPLDGGAK